MSYQCKSRHSFLEYNSQLNGHPKKKKNELTEIKQNKILHLDPISSEW